jgi:hypothetical protein
LAAAGCSGNGQLPPLLLLLLLLAAADADAKLAPHQFVQGCIQASWGGSDWTLRANGLQWWTAATAQDETKCIVSAL